MAYRGPTFYPKNTAVDSTPTTNVCDLSDTSPVTGGGVSSSMAGSTSSATIYQLFPLQGNGTLQQASAANTSLANNKGWWVPPTTGMAGTASDNRCLQAGVTVSAQLTAVCTGLTGNDTITIRVYKRSSAGVLTSIASGSTTAPNGAVGTSTSVNPACSIPSDTLFAAGETLYVELYLTVAQQSLTAGSATAQLVSAWSIASTTNGISWRFLRSHSSSVTFSAVMAKVTGIRRAVTITYTAALQRQVVKTPLAATVTYTAAMTKFLNLRRSFSATVTYTASLLVQMSQAVLNRFSGGTVIKRFFFNVDDG